MLRAHEYLREPGSCRQPLLPLLCAINCGWLLFSRLHSGSPTLTLPVGLAFWHWGKRGVLFPFFPHFFPPSHRCWGKGTLGGQRAARAARKHVVRIARFAAMKRRRLRGTFPSPSLPPLPHPFPSSIDAWGTPPAARNAVGTEVRKKAEITHALPDV